MNLVLTIAMGKTYREIARWTHPSIKAYAKRIGADFLAITKKGVARTTPHWEKFQISKLLEDYERIIYFDTDIIIRDDCPNLFDLVPDDQLGMFDESRFTARSRELMIDTCKEYSVRLPEWNGKYYNSGVMVISQCHAPLFYKPQEEKFSFYEQTYLNMVIALNRVDVFDLHYHFNRMTCVDRFTGEDRANSYIIHYAGALYNITLEQLTNLIAKDLANWKTAKGNYNHGARHIYIAVTGGLGDQLCAEPAVRFMREKLYPMDDMVVATHWPRIFQHLKDEGVTVIEHGKANLREDTPYYITQSLPGPNEVQWAIVSHLLCHTVDYASIALMHRTLPLLDRTIKFEVTLDDYANLGYVVDVMALRDMVVVHPGRHWNSKTFPAAWWNGVISGLLDAGRQVCIIGKDEPGDPPDFVAGARGTVDVAVPDGVVDLRNKLDLGQLGALLSLAPALITNDSAPVHLAGAFENKIVLVPSCKHPDHVLPYRRGGQQYKAIALYKGLVIDTVESRPTQTYPTSAEVEVVDWKALLPNIEQVVDVCRPDSTELSA